MSPDDAASLLVILIILAGAGLFAWFQQGRMRRGADLLRLHLEARNRLLDKVGTSQEFLDFARTEEGRSLLSLPVSPTAPQSQSPAGLRLVQTGIVGMLVGAAFLLQAHQLWRVQYLHSGVEASLDVLRSLDANHWGLFWLAVGLGLFIGGFIARAWSRPAPHPEA